MIRNLTSRYRTPETSPTGERCRVLRIPDDEKILAAINEVLGLLTLPDVWEAYGIDILDVTSAINEMLNNYWEEECVEGNQMSVPYAGIIPFAGDVIPTGFHECNGDWLVGNDYPELLAVIDDVFVFDNAGITTIALPDMATRVPVGYDWHGSPFSMGQTGGQKEVTLNVNTIPPHTHQIQVRGTEDWNGQNVAPADAGSISIAHTNNDGGGGLPHENMPPYICFRYIMRTHDV